MCVYTRGGTALSYSTVFSGFNFFITLWEQCSHVDVLREEIGFLVMAVYLGLYVPKICESCFIVKPCHLLYSYKVYCKMAASF